MDGDDAGDHIRVAEPSGGAASTAAGVGGDAGRLVHRAMDTLIVQQEDDDAVLACTHQEEGERDSSPTEVEEEEEPEGEDAEEERELEQNLKRKREETVKERLERLRVSEDDALHAAAENGHLDVVRKLIEYGADVDAKDYDGKTPLARAADSGHLDVVRELIDRGAAVDAKDMYGRTPLARAAANGHVDVVRELIERSADVDASDNDGTTVLYAAAQGLVRVAKELIANGALVYAVTI